jgi:biotin transporter BioY
VLVAAGALGARRGFAAVALHRARPGRPPFFAEGKGGLAVSSAPSAATSSVAVAGLLVGRLAELGWDRASAARWR